MSRRSWQGKVPALIQVVKVLARQWRMRAAVKAPTTVESMKEYLALPYRTLLSSIEKHTQHSFQRSDLEHFAWYSDRPLERVPTLPRGPFYASEQENDLGLPEVYASGKELAALQIIRDELTKCDEDGRTRFIVEELQDAHPGVIAAVLASTKGEPADAGAKKPKKRRGRQSRSDKRKRRKRKRKSVIRVPSRKRGGRPRSAEVEEVQAYVYRRWIKGDKLAAIRRGAEKQFGPSRAPKEDSHVTREAKRYAKKKSLPTERMTQD